jgi:oligoribonuclease
MRKPKHLLWLDLETTGSSKTEDDIIEVGCALTTPDLETIVDTFTDVASPSDYAYLRLMSNDDVHDMHESNGLLEILQNTHMLHGIEYVEIQLIDWLRTNEVKDHEIMLCGSGVSHFDRRFLERDMPTFEKMLMYPNIDVGVIRRAAYLFAGIKNDPSDLKNHRALDDALLHLEEGRYWKKVFGSLQTA